MSGGPGSCVHNWLKGTSGHGRMFQTGSNFGYCSHSLVLSTAITLTCLQGEKRAPSHPQGAECSWGEWHVGLLVLFPRGETALPEVLICPLKYWKTILYTTINRSPRLHFFLFWKAIRSETQKKNIWYLVLFLQRRHDTHVPSNNSYCSLDGQLINVLSHSINICFAIDKANMCRKRRKKIKPPFHMLKWDLRSHLVK